MEATSYMEAFIALTAIAAYEVKEKECIEMLLFNVDYVPLAFTQMHALDKGRLAKPDEKEWYVLKFRVTNDKMVEWFKNNKLCRISTPVPAFRVYEDVKVDNFDWTEVKLPRSI